MPNTSVGDTPSAPVMGNWHFEHLPAEILMMIARPLETTDLGALRLTCRAVEQALFPSFRHEFFRKKQFMIEDGSLQALLAISQHARLASALEHVIIGFDRFNDWTVARAQVSLAAARQLGTKQFSLLYGGRALAILTEVFRNLKRHGNPKTVDFRDFCSKTRWRDASVQHMWRSYGTRRLQEALGISHAGLRLSRVLGTSSRHDKVGHNFEAAVFVVVLRALAQARVCPENLEVIMRNKLNGLPDAAFDLTNTPDGPGENRDPANRSGNDPSSSMDLRPSLLTVVRNLQRLHLDVRLKPDAYDGSTNSFRQHQDDQTEPAAPEAYIMNLYLFIAAAENVRWLRINFQRSAPLLVESFLEHFACSEDNISPGWDAMLPPPWFRFGPPIYLERLDLGQFLAEPEAVLLAIDRIPTLKELYLYIVTFKQTECSVLEKDYPWHFFLSQLALGATPKELGGTGHLLNLRVFSVTNAGQLDDIGQYRHIYFYGEEFISYKGPQVADFLQMLKGITQVEHAHHDLRDDSNDDDDEENGEGDEDEDEDEDEEEEEEEDDENAEDDALVEH